MFSLRAKSFSGKRTKEIKYFSKITITAVAVL